LLSFLNLFYTKKIAINRLFLINRDTKSTKKESLMFYPRDIEEAAIESAKDKEVCFVKKV